MSESQASEIRRLERKFKTITEKCNTLQKRLKQEDHLWSSKDNNARHGTATSPLTMYLPEVFDHRISTGIRLP